MDKHTPGPWHMNMVSNKTLNVGIYQANGTEVALVKVKSEIEAPRREADARLIAAAPRMIAALQRAAHILAEIDQATAPAVLSLRSEIVAVIKQATPEYYGIKPGEQA